MARSYAGNAIIMILVQGFLLQGVINNLAHLGGFGGGYLVSRILDPLKPERTDHVVIALVCIAASLLSIVVSVATALRFF